MRTNVDFATSDNNIILHCQVSFDTYRHDPRCISMSTYYYMQAWQVIAIARRIFYSVLFCSVVGSLSLQHYH